MRPSIVIVVLLLVTPLLGGVRDLGGVFVEVMPLGPAVNTTFLDVVPTLSRDGLTIYFLSARPGGPGGHDHWVASRPSIDHAFGEAVPLCGPIDTPGDDHTLSVAADNLTVYFASERPEGFGDLDIYSARRDRQLDEDGNIVCFQDVESLGPEINTAFREGDPWISPDGLQLYFYSTRPGGFGGFDLYRASRSSEGEPFRGVTNLGAGVNTDRDEIFPRSSSDGLTLFFTDRWTNVRPGTAGLGDLWLATRTSVDEEFGEARNLGSPVNSGGLEISLHIDADWPAVGSKLYFASDRSGNIDIWEATWMGEFRMEEATITELSLAMEAGGLTSESLVRFYLNRIEAYEENGPALNAFITLNPHAVEAARKLDEERRSQGPRSPVHGIPIVLKDLFDSRDLPTTAGSQALADSTPPDDAFVIRRLRQAGAIILGKTNLDELGIGCISRGLSTLGGQSKNPYAFDRTPGGSSAGSATAVSANLSAAALGTDTGGSIRIPAAYQCLVGVKPTLGLVSHDGVFPATRSRDVSGPMTRTVKDAAILLDVIAGVDPNDPVTERGDGKRPLSYSNLLDPKALRGTRIGVVTRFFHRDEHADVARILSTVADELRAAGAEVVTGLDISAITSVLGEHLLQLFFFNSAEYDINRYLESLGEEGPFQSIREIQNAGGYLDCLDRNFFSVLRGDRPPEEDPEYAVVQDLERQLREGLLSILDEHELDAIVYPTSPHLPPRLCCSDVSLPNTPLASWTRLPAITVPGGFTEEGLPVGIEFIAEEFSESKLLMLAYAYEQATQHRKPPESVPPLDCNGNGIADEQDIASGSSPDADGDWRPDECNRRLEASAAVIDFEEVPLGASASRDLVLESTGTARVEIREITIGSIFFPNPGVRLEPEFQPLALEPGESIAHLLVYVPQAAKPFEVPLVVTSDAVNAPRLTVVLRGSGVEDTNPIFLRGDCNDDGTFDISDAVCILNWLFLGLEATGCIAALNTNGDGNVDIADPVYSLSFSFLGGPAPVAPHPACGPGTLPADDEMGCETPPKSCQE